MSRETLLVHCRAGDQAAFRSLFEQYLPAVLRWGLFLGVAESAVEEIAQEVFITAARKITQCRGPEQLTSWLFQITRRHAANHRRSAWSRNVLSWNSPLDGGENAAAGGDGGFGLSLEIRQVIQRLPTRLLEVLILHDLDGFTREEIARILGIPSGTVASRLNKARQRFEREWEESEP